ncbi:MAG TPA: GxxExxY protein [Anaerolineales bacterium]|nr:GxxExxY protein [Anaerolineales bacterium]
MAELIFKDEVFAIVGAAMEVHTVLGSGHLEAVYQEALEIESRSRKLPFDRKSPQTRMETNGLLILRIIRAFSGRKKTKGIP